MLWQREQVSVIHSIPQNIPQKIHLGNLLEKCSQSNCFIFDIFSMFKLIIAARSCYSLSAGVALFFSIVKQDPNKDTNESYIVKQDQR